MRMIVSLLLLLNSIIPLRACQCPVIEWSKEKAQHYDFIARIIIKNLFPHQNDYTVAEAEIQNLFKGRPAQYCKILFPENDPCALPIRVGEEWLIYAAQKQLNTYVIDWCGWSRKRFVNDWEDFFIATHILTYDEELRKLQQAFPEISITSTHAPEMFHKNIIPNRSELYIYLFLSLVSFLIILLIVKKYNR